VGYLYGLTGARTSVLVASIFPIQAAADWSRRHPPPGPAGVRPARDMSIPEPRPVAAPDTSWFEGHGKAAVGKSADLRSKHRDPQMKSIYDPKERLRRTRLSADSGGGDAALCSPRTRASRVRRLPVGGNDDRPLNSTAVAASGGLSTCKSKTLTWCRQ
jgi:hypothetical protein